MEKATEFVERLKKVQEAGAVLRKAQEEIKRYVDRKRREMEKWKNGDRVMLSTKDLVFKERLAQKLVERYVEPYKIEEIVSLNVVRLQLLSSMRIHLVVSQIRYSLVVILELNSVPEVQYKDMMIDR